MTTVKIRPYPSQNRTESWTKGEEYCPSCGKQEIWTEEGPGNYYVGEMSVCMACGESHYLISAFDDKRFDLLKAASA